MSYPEGECDWNQYNDIAEKCAREHIHIKSADELSRFGHIEPEVKSCIDYDIEIFNEYIRRHEYAISMEGVWEEENGT